VVVVESQPRKKTSAEVFASTSTTNGVAVLPEKATTEQELVDPESLEFSLTHDGQV
jgi:hypothetical protein